MLPRSFSAGELRRILPLHEMLMKDVLAPCTIWAGFSCLLMLVKYHCEEILPSHKERVISRILKFQCDRLCDKNGGLIDPHNENE